MRQIVLVQPRDLLVQGVSNQGSVERPRPRRETNRDELRRRIGLDKLASTAGVAQGSLEVPETPANEFCLIDLNMHRAATPKNGLVPEASKAPSTLAGGVATADAFGKVDCISK